MKSHVTSESIYASTNLETSVTEIGLPFGLAQRKLASAQLSEDSFGPRVFNRGNIGSPVPN